MMMEGITGLIRELVDAALLKARQDALNEAERIGLVIEDHVKKGVIDALDASSRPMIAASFACMLVLAASITTLYGVGLMLEAAIGIQGLGFALSGAIILALGILLSDHMLERLKRNVGEKKVVGGG